MNEPKQPFHRSPQNRKNVHSDERQHVLNQLKLLHWLTELTGVMFCVAGGYRLVRAIHHGGDFILPISCIIGGLAFIEMSSYYTAMRVEKSTQLQADKKHQ